MVAKKSSKKKVVRRKISKKKISKNKKNAKGSISRKDFEAFQFGVQRLDELRKELNSMDTRGFAKEEQAIRVKLKKVSEIPNIEKGIKELKKKIHGRYKPKKRKGPSTKKVLDEGLEDIKEEITKIRRSRKEDMGDIEEEIKKLRETKKRKEKVPLDSGVEILVDTNFNQFLNQTKQALSERVRKREKEIDETLELDLEKRQFVFKKKHDNLLKEFGNKKKKLEEEYHKKYNIKLKTTLHKEVAAEFNKKLKERFDTERVRLGKTYTSQLKAHAKIELENKRQKLEDNLKKELSQRIAALDEEFRKKLAKEEAEERRIKEGIESKKESFEESMKRKKSSFEENMKKKMEKEKAEQERIKKIIENQKISIEAYSEKEKTKLQKAKQDFVLEKEKERKAIKEKVVNDAHREMQNELAKKERVLRKRLQNEFDLRLKKQIQEHEEEIKKKKLDLELEMSKKIKQVLA